MNPVDLLARAAFMYAEKDAVVHGARRYTYAEFAERAWRLANGLRAAGLRKGDRVATLLPNCPGMLEAHFGVPAAGGILVTVNTRLSSAEVEYILRHSGASTLLLDAEFAELVEPLDLSGIEVIRVDDTGAPGDPYEDLLAASSPEQPESWLEDEEETISINYTSGTTGRPKGVQYTYRGAYLSALNEALVTGLSSESVFLWLQPMFHCNGWCFAWGVTAVAGRHLTIRKVEPGLVWDLIDAHGVTNFNGAPTVQLMVINHPKAHRVERQVTVMVAAAPPSPTLFARMDELNFRVIHVYGLTETYGPTTICPEQEEWRSLPAAERARLLSRQGQAYPSSDLVRVVDEQANDVPRDGETMGEVVMRGNIVMAGYLRRPRGDGDGIPRRLVQLRRPRRVASGRERRTAGPRQGHHHLGRGEHLLDRSRADHRRPSVGPRVRCRRDPAPVLGRASQGLRDAEGGHDCDLRGDHRFCP